MAENVPPSKGASGQATDNNADQPGRPYYDSLRATLRESLTKKRKLDEQQAALEESIFKTETAYLEETANSGNIIRGFDGWVKGVQIGRTGVDDRRRARIRDEDRIFSRSSVSWMRAQEGPDSNTPSHAPTPTASFPPAMSARESNANTPAALGVKPSDKKKKRPAEKNDDEDESKQKRGKISYSRE